MPAAYMIVQIKITREAGWPEYRQKVSERRLIVFEFPSMDVIRSVWNSPEYAEVKKLREGAGELDVWAVPGV